METALGVAWLLTCTGKNTVQNWAGAHTIPAEARLEAPTKVRASSGSSNPVLGLLDPEDGGTTKLRNVTNRTPNETAPYVIGNRSSF